MSAIITDQIRILNAKSFVNSLKSGENNLYTFVNQLQVNSKIEIIIK